MEIEVTLKISTALNSFTFNETIKKTSFFKNLVLIEIKENMLEGNYFRTTP